MFFPSLGLKKHWPPSPKQSGLPPWTWWAGIGRWRWTLKTERKLPSLHHWVCLNSNGCLLVSAMPLPLFNAYCSSVSMARMQSCCYLDDIIVYTPDFNTHLQHLEVFAKLHRHGLKLWPDSYSLLQKQVKFLGKVVDKHEVLPDPSKISFVVDWTTLTTVQEVRGILGLAGYYRRFVPNFTKIAHPLHTLLSGLPNSKQSSGRKVEWTETCQSSFDHLKTVLT